MSQSTTPNSDGNSDAQSSAQANGLTYFSAATAGVAQSVSFEALNVIEEQRNQGIIRNTAIGNAYAKWLANPQVGEQFYLPLINAINSDNQDQMVFNKYGRFLEMLFTTPTDSK
jgi:hypothetical protein